MKSFIYCVVISLSGREYERTKKTEPGLPDGQPEEGGDGPLQLKEGVQRRGRGADQPGDVVAHTPPYYQHPKHNNNGWSYQGDITNRFGNGGV